MLDFEFRPERDNKIYIENEATLDISRRNPIFHPTIAQPR